jgi:penicillin amidase
VLIGLVAFVVVIVVVAAVVAISLARRPFPTTSGEISIPGLQGSVSVMRDGQGVPQIYADTTHDLFMAQGFVAAQDRFFEMDVRRHITAGRLSEMVGEDGLDADKVIRTMGWRRVAEQELPLLKPQTRQILQAYADGVNAYIDRTSSTSAMSLEYTVLGQRYPGYVVEPWTPADTLSWLKAMAWDLRGDYDGELTRARLFGRISGAQMGDLYPPYPIDEHQPILSKQDWSPGSSTSGSAIPSALTKDHRTTTPAPTAAVPAGNGTRRAYAAAERALSSVPELIGHGDGIGSNSWVVGPDKSSTGKPILANDPHLGVGIPGIWYQSGLHCREVTDDCPFDVSGFTFSGVPGVIIGHNNRIAWGFTNLGPDVTDFYLERLDGDTYRRDGNDEPLQERPETIKVAGEDDVTITVRSTVHGPLLSDVITSVDQVGGTAPVNGRQPKRHYDVSLAWTALEPNRTADSIIAFNLAQNFQDFRDAAKFFEVPAQNLVYADVDGHIGYQAPGKIPIRRAARANDPPGYWPAKGWESTWDWRGYVPFDQMPYALDPPEGFIVAANQAVTAYDRPFLTTEWDYGYRSQRIRDMLEAKDTVTPADMAQMQLDTRNDFAARLVPFLLKVDLDDAFTREARQLLRTWDFTNPADNSDEGAAAAYYNAVWAHLVNLTFNDELPTDLQSSGGSDAMQSISVLLDKPDSLWWDNRQTAGVTEGRDEILRQALVDARLDLTRRVGKDPTSWEWGKLHRLELRSQILGGSGTPGYVRMLFNRGPYEMPGGSAIVNANGWNASEGFDVNWAPSMRMVVDLSDLDASRWVNQTGASGHAYNAHYNDQVDEWVNGETFPWPFSAAAVEDSTDDTLTLNPRDSG